MGVGLDSSRHARFNKSSFEHSWAVPSSASEKVCVSRQVTSHQRVTLDTPPAAVCTACCVLCALCAVCSVRVRAVRAVRAASAYMPQVSHMGLRTVPGVAGRRHLMAVALAAAAAAASSGSRRLYVHLHLAPHFNSSSFSFSSTSRQIFTHTLSLFGPLLFSGLSSLRCKESNLLFLPAHSFVYHQPLPIDLARAMICSR